MTTRKNLISAVYIAMFIAHMIGFPHLAVVGYLAVAILYSC